MDQWNLDQPEGNWQPDPAIPMVVPPNADEVAGQLALADDTNPNYEDSFKNYSQRVAAGETRPAVDEISKQDKAVEVEARRKVADETAKTGDASLFEQTARDLQAAIQKQKEAPTTLEGMQATATRAAENVGIAWAGRKQEQLADIAERAAKAGVDLSLRNLILYKAAEMEGGVGFSDKAMLFAGEVFAMPFYEVRAQQALNKMMGTGGWNPLTMFGKREDFIRFMSAMDVTEQAAVIEALSREAVGMGESKAATIHMLQRLADMTASDSIVDAVFNSLTAFDVATIGHLLTNIVKKGKPLIAIQRVGGDEAAGNAVVHDLLSGTKITGLEDADKVGSLLAAGRNPYDFAPDVRHGMSSAGQQRLQAAWNKAQEDVRNRLISSGRTQEEIQAGLNELRDKWMQSPDPAMRAVFFKEGSELGQRMTVEWVGPDGKTFLSREAADSFAKERGLTNYEIVPRNVDELPISKAEAYHGTGTPISAFRTPEAAGAVGWGISTTKAQAVADMFAQLRGSARGAEGPIRLTVDIPEDTKFLRRDLAFGDQPEEVKAGLLKVLPKEQLENKTGEDIYNYLIDKLGSSEAASKKLDEAGVKGIHSPDTNADVGAYGEHLVFNPKNVKIKKEDLLPRDEAFASKRAADKAEADRLDEEANALLTNPNVSEAFLETMQDMVRRGRLDDVNEAVRNIGKTADKNIMGGRFLRIGADIPEKVGKVAGEWLRLLRLEHEDTLILSPRELWSWGRRAGLDDNSIAHFWKMAAGPRVEGAFAAVPTWASSTRKRINIIVLSNTKISDELTLQTLAHEMGHMFDVTALSRVPEARLKELIAHFKNWAKEKGRDTAMADEFFMQFRAPRRGEVEGLTKLQGKQMKDIPQALLTNVRQGWYSSVGEWWAEQFTKFMTTDARALTPVEKWFEGLAQTLKEFFAKVARTFGMATHNPDEIVRALMDDYLTNPNFLTEPPSTSHLLTTSQAELSMSQGLKPRIKSKIPAESKPATEYIIREDRTEPLPYSSVGKYTKEDIESMPMLGVDPKHRVSEQAMEERIIGVHAEAKVKNDLSKMVFPFFDRLSNDGRKRVMKVLERGDSFSNPGGVTGKEYSYGDLRAMGLDEAEAEAYFAARQARMMSYHLRNGEMVRNLKAQGFKEVTLAGEATPMAGRRLERADANMVLGRTFYDFTKGEATSATSNVLDEAYGSGKYFIELAHPIQLDRKYYYTLLVDNSVSKEKEIVSALHYRPGEFSRIYTDEYFIKTKKLVSVDGQMKEIDETVRTATTAKEAAEYVAAHKAAIKLLQDRALGTVPRNIEAELERLVGKYGDVEDLKSAWQNGELDGWLDMYPHYTRTKEEFLNGSVSEALATGRLFTSKRSNKLFSVDRDRVNTLNPYESLEAELTNISRVVNISQWRETQIRKWMNTFGHMLPTRTGNDVADFFSVSGTKFTHNTKEAVFAERTHAYILKQMGIRTAEERFYQNGVRMLTETIEKRMDNKVVNAIGAVMRKESFINFIRKVNFNFNLGLFNPAQLLIQANGALTAVAISPLHGAAAARMFPLLRVALMSDNPKVWAKMASFDTMASLGLSNTDEFVKVVQAIRKSGILANTRSTALWNMENGALNLFGGMPRRAMKEHTFFFDRGEEFSRVVAFDVARREWMKANPGKEWFTDAGIKELVVRMDDLTQNMTKANLASFQEGLISVPLQFAQFHIKLASNIITGALLGKGQAGRGFTRKEALSILTANLVAYGLAGNGLMWLAEELIPNTEKEKMDEGQKMAIAQGAVGWLVHASSEALTGKGNATTVGERLGSFNYWQQFAKNLMDGKLWNAMLGPSMSTVNRLGVIGDVVQLWYKDPDVSGRDVIEGLGRITAEQMAVTRNATKAYLMYMHGGKVYGRDGAPMASVGMNEMLMQALGFSPAALGDTYELIATRKDHREAMRDIARLISETQRNIMLAHKNGDKQRVAELNQLMQALWPDNAGDLMEVRRMIQDEIFPSDTVMNKLIEEYIIKGQTHNQPLTITNPPRK